MFKFRWKTERKECPNILFFAYSAIRERKVKTNYNLLEIETTISYKYKALFLNHHLTLHNNNLTTENPHKEEATAR